MSELSLFSTRFQPIALAPIFAKLAQAIGIGVTAGATAMTKGMIQGVQWVSAIDRNEFFQSRYLKETEEIKLRTLGKCGLTQSLAQGGIAEKLIHLEAMSRSVQSQGLIKHILETCKPAQWSEVQTNIEMLKTASIEENRPDLVSLAQKTDAMIRSLVSDANQSLAKAEKQVSLELMSRALSSMGYQVRERDGALVGNKSDTTIKATIRQDGQVVFDTKSFAGLSCQREVAELENRLRKEGLDLRRMSMAGAEKDIKVALKDPFPAMDKSEVAPAKAGKAKAVHAVTSEQHVRQQQMIRQRSRSKLKGA